MAVSVAVQRLGLLKREEVLDSLRGAFAEAAAGRGQLVLVSGATRSSPRGRSRPSPTSRSSRAARWRRPSGYQASSPEAIRSHAYRAGLPVDEIVGVADTVIVRPDPAAAAA